MDTQLALCDQVGEDEEPYQAEVVVDAERVAGVLEAKTPDKVDDGSRLSYVSEPVGQ